MDHFGASLIEGLDEAVIVTDDRLNVVAWNAAMERLTGVARDAALGRPAATLLLFLRDPTTAAHLERALHGEVSLTGALRYEAGEPARSGWLEGRYLPWHGAGGGIGGVIGVHVEVTERRRTAAFVRALAAIGQSLTSSLDLNEVLDTIVGKALEVMNAESALVTSWDGQAPQFTVMRATGRLSKEYAARGSIPVGGGPISRTILQARTITTPNIQTDPDTWLDPARRAQIEREGFKAVASAPLRSKGRVHGALVVHYWTERTFTEEEVAPLQLLAEQAALAIDNARIYADATRRAERLHALVAIAQSITASLDARDVMQRIAQAAAGMAPGAMAAVEVLDEDGHVLRAAAVSDPGEWEGRPFERASTAGLAGLVVERRAPVLVADPLTHPRTLAVAWWQRRPKAAYYGVPIAVGDTFVGVLDYILPEGLPDSEDQEALRLLAAQAGVAIRNARLYQGERVQAERVRALAGINQRISSTLDIDALLRTISESAAQLTGVRYVAFWLADEAAQTLSLAGGSVAEMTDDFPQRQVSYDADAVGWVARHHEPLGIDDVFADPRMLNHEWWRRWGVRAFVGYPVLAGDELLAVLVLSHAEPVRVTADMADVIEMFIAQASVAIRNARLYREAQRRRDVAEVLARLGRDLTGTLDDRRIAELVTRGIVDLLNVRGSAMFRYEPETGALHSFAAFGPESDVARGLVLQPGEGIGGRAVRERTIVVTSDILGDPSLTLPEELRERIRRTARFRAAVAVPLFTRERIIGAITVGDRAGRTFTADELQAVQAFADQAALAFENARLYASAQESLTRLKDTQAQLVQAAKMSALGQLVSGVAHELNNPLSVIIGYGQLLLAREIPPALKRPVELMVSQGDRMAKIVKNLLYFARQRPPERAAVDLTQVIEQTLALRQNQLMLSGITVEKDFAPKLPVITGDTQQLEQVFLNLLLNAEQAILEAKPSGRIRLRTCLSDDGASVLAQVADDGPGIPPDALPRLFEPFFTTKMVGSGTGLGLSVSYGIVEEHGGRLSVQSAPGETVFTLELAVSPSPPAVTGTQQRRPALRGEGRMALVVEDEPSVLELVVTLLKDGGWRVDVAPGGRLGLEAVRHTTYDLIVSDMRMPEGDGEEFYKEVLAHDPALGRRFIFITGDTANPEARAFLTGTSVPVIEKPFPPVVFEEAVHRVMTALTASTPSA